MNNKDDFDLIKMSPKRRENDGYEDISSSYEDIYSKSRHSGGNAPRKSTKGKKKKRKKHIFLKIFAAVLCAAVIFGACFYAYGYRTIEKIPRTPLDSADLGISTIAEAFRPRVTDITVLDGDEPNVRLTLAPSRIDQGA